MSRPGANRLAIQAAIEATARDDGIITADCVVEAARDEANPLHHEFDWNDSSAAHQHRLAVARALIREIRIEVVDTPRRQITKLSYVHDPRAKGQAYIPLSRVARSKQLAKEVMEAELSRCESAIVRAREVADAIGLRDDLDELLRQLIAVRKKASRSEPKRRGSVRPTT